MLWSQQFSRGRDGKAKPWRGTGKESGGVAVARETHSGWVLEWAGSEPTNVDAYIYFSVISQS